MRIAGVFGAPDSTRNDRYARLGYVAGLLATIPRRPKMPMEAALWLADVAISVEQIKLYFARDGQPVAYASWALLAEEVERRIARLGFPLLHVSEWNEGSLLWIVDLVAPYGHLPYVLCDLRDEVFSEHQKACYLRTKGEGHVAREIRRSSIASIVRKRTIPMLAGVTELPGWRAEGTDPWSARLWEPTP